MRLGLLSHLSCWLREKDNRSSQTVDRRTHLKQTVVIGEETRFWQSNRVMPQKHPKEKLVTCQRRPMFPRRTYLRRMQPEAPAFRADVKSTEGYNGLCYDVLWEP